MGLEQGLGFYIFSWNPRSLLLTAWTRNQQHWRPVGAHLEHRLGAQPEHAQSEFELRQGQSCCPKSVVLTGQFQASSSIPGNLLELLILGPRPRPTESATLGSEPSHLWFGACRCCRHAPTFESRCCTRLLVLGEVETQANSSWAV